MYTFVRPFGVETGVKLFLKYYIYIAYFTVNGGYSSWNLGTECNVTCGQGVEIWRRLCDNPKPKNGGRNCAELGKDVEDRICKRRPCSSTFLLVLFSSSS